MSSTCWFISLLKYANFLDIKAGVFLVFSQSQQHSNAHLVIHWNFHLMLQTLCELHHKNASFGSKSHYKNKNCGRKHRSGRKLLEKLVVVWP
jgi:hypothetical protein